MNKGQNQLRKGYDPSERLQSFFKVRLRLSELQAGQRSAAGDSKVTQQKSIVKKAKHDSMEILFQSMANLVYFFEEVSADNSNQDDFEKDIQHLLGIGQHLYDKEPDPTFWPLASTPYLMEVEDTKRSKVKLDPANITSLQQLQSNFARLLSAILSISIIDEKDFRLVLTSIMQDLISFKLLALIATQYSEMPRILNAAKEDLNNAKAWAVQSANTARPFLETTRSKRVLFEPKRYGGVVYFANKKKEG